ncbi:MAG: sigma-70 family RNA polymerase sigma factor [Stenotrophobium sp.]
MPADSPESDDREQIRLLLARDARACEITIRRYQPLMMSVARGIVRDTQIAEEVVQEAWISAFRALPGFEYRSSFKTWLLRIVSNEAKDRLRGKPREVSLEDMAQGPASLGNDRFDNSGHWREPPALWEQDTPEALLSEEHLRDCLQKHMDLLPSAQRAVMIMRELESLDFEEIAVTLAITEQNVRVMLHRARLRIYGMIERYQESGEC